MNLLSFYKRSLHRSAMFLIPACGILLNACGEPPVEGDKYPDIPTFPRHTNPNIIIKPFANFKNPPMQKGNYIFGWGEDLYSHKGTGFLIYDRHFHLLKVLKPKAREGETVLPNIDVRNGIYIYTSQGMRATRVYRLQLPSFQKQKIPIYKLKNIHKNAFSKEAIAKKYDRLIKRAASNQDYFDKDTYIARLGEQEKAKMLFSNGIQRIMHLDESSSILIYKDRIIVIQYQYNKKWTPYKYNSGYGTRVSYIGTANSFSKSVTRNVNLSYYGLGSDTALGYDYISLKIGNERTKTKVDNCNKKTGLYILYKDQHKVIVMPSENTNRWYIVRKR